MSVVFYHKKTENGMEFRINDGKEDRLATMDDKKKYPAEYKAEKMKRAGEPPVGEQTSATMKVSK